MDRLIRRMSADRRTITAKAMISSTGMTSAAAMITSSDRRKGSAMPSDRVAMSEP